MDLMNQFFIYLNNAITSSSYIALFAALIWGFLSVLISPCHLATIPLIIGFISSKEDLTTKKAFKTSLIFSVGIFISILIIGLITASLGRILGDIGIFGNILIAIIFIIVGLNLIGFIPFNWDNNFQFKSLKKRTGLQAFILGLMFGIGLGPCTFAFIAPMLGVIFQMASDKLYFSISLLLLFAVGHISVIILAGTFTGILQKYLNWTKKSTYIKIIRIICGILVCLWGIYMILKAFLLV